MPFTGFSEDLGRLRVALEASCVVGTWNWDHARGVITYDLGAARLLAGDPALAGREISGVSAAAAVHPEDRDWLAAHMKQAARTGGLVLAEYRVQTPDGSVRWLLSRGRTYQDAAGHPLRSNGILIDITEMHDGGERYILGSPLVSQHPLERAANLAIALKQVLGTDASSEAHTATDLVLFSLGRMIAQTEGS